jgi:hypothetical protein
MVMGKAMARGGSGQGGGGGVPTYGPRGCVRIWSDKRSPQFHIQLICLYWGRDTGAVLFDTGAVLFISTEVLWVFVVGVVVSFFGGQLRSEVGAGMFFAPQKKQKTQIILRNSGRTTFWPDFVLRLIKGAAKPWTTRAGAAKDGIRTLSKHGYKGWI